MNVSYWTPPDISPICSEAASLSQCSINGLFYLSLLSHLFGRSVEEDQQKTNEEICPRSEASSVSQEEIVYENNFNESSDSSQNASENANEIKIENERTLESEAYDFIIVGAGSAGCVLANRLSDVKEWKILLLEAGSEEPNITSVPSLLSVLSGSSIDWGYHTQPEERSCRGLKNRACVWPRGKTMGGSSATNYMVYMRGNKADYDGWADAGNPGWNYDDVLPCFKKSENNREMSFDTDYHATGGLLNVERFSYIDTNAHMIVQAFTEKGLPITDFNGENQYGTNILCQSTSIHGQRLSVNSAYIKAIKSSRPNLKIIHEAFVTKIIINQNTKTAIGVEYLRDGKKCTVFAAKEVISSAGSINSPKLLMLSGIGPKEHLADLNIPVLADLQVGQNLQDHVTTDGLLIALSNKTSTSVDVPQLFDEIYDYYRQPPNKHGPLASTGVLNAVGFIKTEFAKDNVPDIQIHFDVRRVEEFLSDPSTYLATNVFPHAFYDGLSPKPFLLVPKSRGYILLNDTDPVFGPPLLYPGYFTDQEDLDRVISAMKFVVSLEETNVFRDSGAVYVKTPLPGCEKFQWGSDEYFECILFEYTISISHQAGTCKMGPIEDKQAVVDSKLRVYGIDKLRVVDASVMPSIVRGNLNAPTIMIAEKIADIIRRKYGQ